MSRVIRVSGPYLSEGIGSKKCKVGKANRFRIGIGSLRLKECSVSLASVLVLVIVFINQ